jgi:hypothetical protein
MPTNKDFKRLVRARMQKTGESYTAARSHFLRTAPFIQTIPDPAEYPRLAGVSDATIKAKTGCTWERWVNALDRVKAHTWPHREIAEYCYEKYKVPGWWAQSVAVGYERIKGLREIGQRRTGEYEASKSKVFPVPLAKLYRRFSDRRARASWLPGVLFTVRKATRNRSMRITWPDQTNVDVGFFARGATKSQVAVQHGKLPNRAAVDRVKQYWTERFAALEQALTPARRRA